MHHHPIIYILTLVTSLMLASCSRPASGCTDPLGCVEIPAGNPVILGALLATQGQQAAPGSTSLQSVEQAISNHGDLLGHPLKLVHLATDCSAESAREAATRLSLEPDLLAVIGPSCAEESGVALPILAVAGIPALSPGLDPAAAFTLTNQVIQAIQQVAVWGNDNALTIPRQALQDVLTLSP